MSSLLLPLMLAPAIALGQTGTVAHSDLSRGVNLPPTSAAFVDDATATAINPGALTLTGDTQLFYAHERSLARGQVADGLYLSDALFETLGVGFSLEWIRGAGPDYRKTAWGLSFGSTSLSLGFAYNSFASGEDQDLDGLSSFDLGLSGRPSRYFSFGAVVRNVDAPAHGDVSLVRQVDLAVGLRPAGERFTVGIDYLFDAAAIGAGRLGYTARAEVLRGVQLSAGVSHGLRSTDDLFLQLSLTVDTSHFGVTYAAASATPGMNHTLLVRLSRQKHRGVSFADGTVAMFDLEQLLSDEGTTLSTLLGLDRADPYLRLARLLDDAAKDPDLRGVVLKIGSIEGGLGKAEELRNAVLRLRAAGKKVLAVLLVAEDAEYLVASAADRVYAVPESILLIDGLLASSTFLGGTMERIGVSWDVARVGAYKNAPDPLTRREMSPEQREAVNALLDSFYSSYVERVSKSRNLPPEKVRAALDEGIKTSRRARELMLVDEVITPDQLESKLDELVPGARFDDRYRPRDVRSTRWGERRKVAIVPVLGTIAGGRSREDPLGLSETAGAQTVIEAIQRAADDPDIAAIVVRVDSGGGDGLASDLIYREVLEAKKKKPVVASMGDAAASGGYYVAMGADEIWAAPTTVTGSIGVFMLKPSFGELASKLSATYELEQRGKLAGLLNPYRPWTPEERKAAQAWIDAFYDDFITEVAKSRRLSKEQVDQVARGRIWSGTDAKAHKLVDQLGGLLEAVEAARKRAGVPEGEEIDLVVQGESGGLFGDGPSVTKGLLAATNRPPRGLRRLASELGLDPTLLSSMGVWAAMEPAIQVR